MRILAIVLVLGCGTAVRAQRPAAPLDTAVSAKTVGVTASVEWSKNSEALNTQAEFDRIFSAVDNSTLYSRYKPTKATKADILIKIDEDRMFSRISMSVLNPDDNSEIYTESRDLVALDNDINRLVAHFIEAVQELRSNNLAKAESSSHPVPAEITSSQPEQGPLTYLWVGRFESEEKARSTAKKIEDMELPAMVIPRHLAAGEFFAVFCGPIETKKVSSVMQRLEDKGFSNVHSVGAPMTNTKAK